jgi:hypothetical protein
MATIMVVLPRNPRRLERVSEKEKTHSGEWVGLLELGSLSLTLAHTNPGGAIPAPKPEVESVSRNLHAKVQHTRLWRKLQ